MSNTNTSYLFPEFWAQSFESLNMGEYNLHSLVSRDFSQEIATAGDKVTVPLAPDFGDADDFIPGDAITATGVTQEVAEVNLNISLRKTIGLTAKELSMAPYDLIQNYGVGMMKSLISTVNRAIYAEALKSPYIVNALSAIDEDSVADAGTLLSNMEVDIDGRILCVSPDFMGALNKTDAFQYVDRSGFSDIMNNGIVTRRMGFDVYQNNAIATYTPADVAGTVSSGEIGAEQIAVTNFADAAKPLRAGDIFTIEDDTTVYNVLSTTKTGGNTTIIELSPDLAVAVESAKIITVVPTQSALAFVPSAMAFAARAYGNLPEGTGVNSMVMDYQGLPIRISVFHDGQLGLGVQADVLCGITLANPKRMVRIITDDL